MPDIKEHKMYCSVPKEFKSIESKIIVLEVKIIITLGEWERGREK